METYVFPSKGCIRSWKFGGVLCRGNSQPDWNESMVHIERINDVHRKSKQLIFYWFFLFLLYLVFWCWSVEKNYIFSLIFFRHLTHDYHNVNWEKKKPIIYFIRIEWFFPSPKDALHQTWLKLAKWFWRRMILNFVNVFSPFHNCPPLEKGGALFLNKLESSSPKNAVWSLVEISPVVLEKMMKMRKVYDNYN